MDNVSLDFLNGFLYQSSVQETDTTASILNTKTFQTGNYVLAKTLPGLKEQSLSQVFWNSSHNYTELTNSRTTTSGVTTRNTLKQESLLLPTQTNTPEAKKCAPGATVQGKMPGQGTAPFCLTLPWELGFGTHNTIVGDPLISWESVASSNSKKPQEDSFCVFSNLAIPTWHLMGESNLHL